MTIAAPIKKVQQRPSTKIFVAVNAQYDASESSFESWRAKYQVVYKSVDEATHRYGVWIANLRRVARHNGQEERLAPHCP